MMLRARIDGEGTQEKSRRPADRHTPYPAAPQHRAVVVQRNARERWLEHGAALAHALARLGETPRPEGAVEHALDLARMLRPFGDQFVTQGAPTPWERRVLKLCGPNVNM